MIAWLIANWYLIPIALLLYALFVLAAAQFCGVGRKPWDRD